MTLRQTWHENTRPLPLQRSGRSTPALGGPPKPTGCYSNGSDSTDHAIVFARRRQVYHLVRCAHPITRHLDQLFLRGSRSRDQHTDTPSYVRRLCRNSPPLCIESVRCGLKSEADINRREIVGQTLDSPHTTVLRLYGFVWDNPGEPVPQETFTHSHLSWSSIVPYLLHSSSTIHGILPAQSTRLTIPFPQSLSKFSLVYLMVWHPPLPLHSTPLTGRAIRPQRQGHIGGPIAQP